MYLARVIGDVVVTRKDENLTGLKLLILQPLTPDRQPAGRTLIAADAIGAGVGEAAEGRRAGPRWERLDRPPRLGALITDITRTE